MAWHVACTSHHVWSAPTPATHEAAPRFLAVDPHEGWQTSALLARVRDRAALEAVPEDWCYVHHFAEPDTPRAVALPAGGGRRLQLEVDRAVEAIRAVMRGALSGDRLRRHRRDLAAALRAREERALASLSARARQRDVGLVREAARIVVAPLRRGVALTPESLGALPKRERGRRMRDMAQVAHELEALLRDFRGWARDVDRAGDEVTERAAREAVRRVLDPLRASYTRHAAVTAYLLELERDVVAHAEQLAEADAPGVESDAPPPLRYRVRVVVDHAGVQGAPVVYEPQPTYANLVGRSGTAGADADATHWVQPGALHRASGGYLVLDADEVAKHASVRLALRRTVLSGEIVIDSLAHAMGIAKNLGGRPDPIPFGRTTIVLSGSGRDYERLAAADPAFGPLFALAG